MKNLALAVLISFPLLSLSANADNSTNNTSSPSEKNLNIGIDHNWIPVAVDLLLDVRSTSDYSNFIKDTDDEGEVFAVSASLLVSTML